MPLIAGLGNIGRKYAGTRHNIGFDMADRLAHKLSARFSSGRGSYAMANGRYDGQKVVIIKPTTYMNRSGLAVQHALNYYGIDRSELLVCYDDIALPLGKLRLRSQGSAGGHNGIKDIINHLGTNDFSRLRIGIGNEFSDGNQVDYVLSRFNEDELAEMDKTLDHAVDAVLCFVREGIEEAMNRFN